MTKARINLSTIKSVVKSAASSTKQFLWDSEVRGFGVYKNSSGVPTFVYQFRFNGGRTQRITLGTLGELTVETARAFASTLAHQVRTGTDPIAKKRADIAAAEAETGLGIAGYFDGYLERRRTGSDPMSASQENVFRRDLVVHLGASRLDKLTVADVDGFKAELYHRGPSMVRSGLVCLRTIINDAINRGALVRTAAHAFEVPATAKRERRIDEWEACRLLEAARDLGGPRGDVLEVLIRLGKRKEEVAELPWEELDMQKRHWRLPSDRNKSKKPHLILLPDQVYDIITRQQPDTTKRKGPVFTINGTAPVEMGSQVKDFLDALLHRRVEMRNRQDGTSKRFEQYTVHDVRKAPASRLAEAPFMYSRDLINSMLLHTNGDELDAVYILTKLVQETGDMVQRWNDHIDAIMSQESSEIVDRGLQPMTPSERRERLHAFRECWSKRADQIRAETKETEKPKRRRKG